MQHFRADELSPRAGLRQFLQQLGTTSLIEFDGRDASRYRMVVTLQHGNEPSGSRAIKRLLEERIKPATQLLCVIANVEAALTEPILTHRARPGERDMNRCYADAIDDRPGAVAAAITALIERKKPEAIVDLHNTSGDGPGFAVSTDDTPAKRALGSWFIDRMILSHFDLGTLMELSTEAPIVTIECGGARQQASHDLAYGGLCRFAMADDPFVSQSTDDIRVYAHSFRVEIQQRASVSFADAPGESDFTIRQNADQLNFTCVEPHVPIGWTRSGNLDLLRVNDEHGNNRVDDYFVVDGGLIYTRNPLNLFMITTNPDIAKSDCLMYFTE